MISMTSASERDSDFILYANRQINLENQTVKTSQLSHETLLKDIFCQNPVAFITIARIEDKSIALVLYCPLYFANSGRVIWVSQLYTDPAYRGKGIAKLLIDHVRKEHNNAPLFWMTMNLNETAQIIFTKLGAKKIDDFILYGLTAS